MDEWFILFEIIGYILITGTPIYLLTRCFGNPTVLSVTWKIVYYLSLGLFYLLKFIAYLITCCWCNPTALEVTGQICKLIGILAVVVVAVPVGLAGYALFYVFKFVAYIITCCWCDGNDGFKVICVKPVYGHPPSPKQPTSIVYQHPGSQVSSSRLLESRTARKSKAGKTKPAVHSSNWRTCISMAVDQISKRLSNNLPEGESSSHNRPSSFNADLSVPANSEPESPTAASQPPAHADSLTEEASSSPISQQPHAVGGTPTVNNNNNLVLCRHEDSAQYCSPLTDIEIPWDIFELLDKLDEGQELSQEELQRIYGIRNKEELNPHDYYEYFKPLVYYQCRQDIKSLAFLNSTKVDVDVDDLDCILLHVPSINEEKLKAAIPCAVKITWDNIVHHGDVKGMKDGSLVLSNMEKNFLQNLKLCKRLELPVIDNISVEFSPSTEAARVRLHAAKTISNNPSFFEILFPKENRKPLKLNSFQYNDTVAWSKEQKTAVRLIVNSSAKPAPYIVLGAPGTGKTTVLVEAIVQLVKNVSTRILVCALSDQVCDDIAQKVAKFVPSTITRFISDSYVGEPKGFRYTRKFCCTQDAEVTVCTLIDSVRAQDLQSLAYTHVFIDEAGGLLECEAVTAILKLKQGGQLVLAGDQLPPISLFLLLERLTSTIPLYQMSNGKYNSQYITVLNSNVRCHAKILSITNQLFYDNMLRSKCTYDLLSEYCLKTGSAGGGAALIFHAIIGREHQSRGWSNTDYDYYNAEEIEQVVHYVKVLLGVSVTEHEIGILTPYNEQTCRIRETLKQFGWCNITVGDTKTFLGQGRRVIIISTVRSQSYRSLKSERMFIAMLTRAAAKCIVIGNPFVLRCDDYWAFLIDKTISDKCYIRNGATLHV